MPGIDPTADPRGIGGVAAGWRPRDAGEKVSPRNAGDSLFGEFLHQEAPIASRAMGDPRYGPPLQGDEWRMVPEAGLAGVRGIASWAMGQLHPDSTRGAKDRAAAAVQSALVFPEEEAIAATEEEVENVLKNPLISYEHEHGEGAYNPAFYHIERTAGGKNVAVPTENVVANTSLAHVRPHSGYIYKGMSNEEYEAFQQTHTINHSSYHTTPEAAERAANHDAPSQFKPSQGRPAYVITVKRPHPSDIVGERGTDVELGRPMHSDEIVGIHRGDPILQEPGWEEKGAVLHWRPIKGRHQFQRPSLEEPEGGMASEEYPPLHVAKNRGYGGRPTTMAGMEFTQYKNAQDKGAEEAEYARTGSVK